MENKLKLRDIVRKGVACDEAVAWAEGKSWREIYANCPRGDWLLWLFVRVNPDAVRERTLAGFNSTLVQLKGLGL